MSYDETIQETQEKLSKALDHTKDVLRSVRTSRASPALVENIRVDYYGTPTPISQMATVSVPEARMLVIKPFDGSILQEMGKAIMKSDLGITPENDGKILRLTLPHLSGEQRNKYAAKVKEICEEGRIAMRNSRRDMNKHADQLKKDGELTEDDNRALHDEIQKLLKDYEGKLDQVQEKKQSEILEL
ncbi:MAG: ribosome recycling factor [Planctomycetota bacterium]